MRNFGTFVTFRYENSELVNTMTRVARRGADSHYALNILYIIKSGLISLVFLTLAVFFKQTFLQFNQRWDLLANDLCSDL